MAVSALLPLLPLLCSGRGPWPWGGRLESQVRDKGSSKHWCWRLSFQRFEGKAPGAVFLCIKGGKKEPMLSMGGLPVASICPRAGQSEGSDSRVGVSLAHQSSGGPSTHTWLSHRGLEPTTREANFATSGSAVFFHVWAELRRTARCADSAEAFLRLKCKRPALWPCDLAIVPGTFISDIEKNPRDGPCLTLRAPCPVAPGGVQSPGSS